MNQKSLTMSSSGLNSNQHLLRNRPQHKEVRPTRGTLLLKIAPMPIQGHALRSGNEGSLLDISAQSLHGTHFALVNALYSIAQSSFYIPDVSY